MTRLYWFRYRNSDALVVPKPIKACSLKQAVHKLGLVKGGPVWACDAYMDGRIELDRTAKLETKKKPCKERWR